MYKIHQANIKDWARDYEGPLFDGILCDPPYELGFMGKSWDSSGIAFDQEMWADIFKLLKPGGHLLAFSGSRTYHRMAVAIEDAGFEIRDMIEWVYGSGFPKSLNIGKAVDKIQGNERELLGDNPNKRASQTDYSLDGKGRNFQIDVQPLSKGTSPYEGYGTALKPAHEPCVLARKPLEKGMTVAGNVLKHGVGGIAIDNTRIKPEYYLQGNDLTSIIRVCQLDHLLLPVNSVELKKFQDDTTNVIKRLCSVLETADMPTSEKTHGTQQENIIKKITSCLEETLTENTKLSLNTSTSGKKPTDEISQQDMKYITSMVLKMITDWKISSSSVSQLIGALLTQAKTLKTTSDVQGRFPSNLIHDGKDEVEAVFPNESSRFFYTAKASKSERNAGLDVPNSHPTLKPLSLTKYLATLIKPPTGGRLLVPFSGSGSEMIGALQAGWEEVIGVELTEEYIPIAEARIKYWLEQKESEQIPLL